MAQVKMAKVQSRKKWHSLYLNVLYYIKNKRHLFDFIPTVLLDFYFRKQQRYNHLFHTYFIKRTNIYNHLFHIFIYYHKSCLTFIYFYLLFTFTTFITDLDHIALTLLTLILLCLKSNAVASTPKKLWQCLAPIHIILAKISQSLLLFHVDSLGPLLWPFSNVVPLDGC